MKKYFAALSLSAACMPAYAQVMTPEAAFGAREGIMDVTISPDGRQVAYITPAAGQGSLLYTVEIGSDAAPKLALSATGDPERLSSCDWISNTRLICQLWASVKLDNNFTTMSRLAAVNADGSNLKVVTKKDGANALGKSLFGGNIIDLSASEDGSVLLGRGQVAEQKTGTILSKNAEGYGVDQVNTQSLDSKQVIRPMADVTQFISDGKGTIRIMAIAQMERDFDTGRRLFRYHPQGSDEWKDLSVYNGLDDSGFYPIAVDPVENVAYGFERVGGFQSVYKVALDGSLTKTKVFERPNVDVDDLILLGRQRKVVGVSYAAEKRQAVYFDPVLSKLSSSLAKALPNSPQLGFTGLSADEQKVIVHSGGDTDPGTFYFYDRGTKQLGELFPSRPELKSVTLASVKPVSIKVADGTMVPGYLTLPPGSDGKNLPALVMPHGGPSARDEWGFDWLSQYFAHKGFAVLQPNYRGSSGYGDAWYQNNGFQSWKTAIGDVNDSGKWLVSEGIADPSKLAIFGWSYGGYAALQSGVLDPGLYKAIVAVAPVTDLAKLRDEDRNFTSYNVTKEFIGSGPHIVEGSPARNATKIAVPVLMFHGKNDVNVSISQSKFMDDKLTEAKKAHELVTFDKLDHYLEDDAARAQLLGKSYKFLAETMKLK